MNAAKIRTELDFIKSNNSKICRDSIADAVKCLTVPRSLVECEISGQCPKLYRRYKNPQAVLRQFKAVEKALLKLQKVASP